MKTTLEDRKELMMFLVTNDTIGLSIKEQVKLVYKWSRYEFTLLKLGRVSRKADRLARSLDEDVTVYVFRHNLNDEDGQEDI